MQRYYVSCPDCRTRMKMTGKQVEEIQTINGEWIYDREYQCPHCGSVWWFSANRNLYHHPPKG